MTTKVQVAAICLALASTVCGAQSGAAPNIYQYAGNGNPGSGGDGCPAASAYLDPVYSLASDAAGNLYIADFESSRIRRIDHATGMITTVAGTGTPGFSGDGGAAVNAELNQPYGVALDGAGNLFIADSLNYRIRRVDAETGTITTVAGTGTQGYGGDNGPATAAEIGILYGLAVDGAGNLYIGDDSNFRIRKVSAATGAITTIAGDGNGGSSGDGGPATSAEIFGLLDLALDQAGNLYFADTENFRIRKVDAATGIITTVAGNGARGYGGDGGPATAAELNEPEALASDGAGNLTIVDVFNNRVRRVDAATGTITTVAGNGVQGFGPMGGPAIDSALNEPTAVALDAAGDIFIDVQGVTQILVVGAAPEFPPIATQTALKATPTSLISGQMLTLTATVTASTCTTPAGTVSFFNLGSLLGSETLDGSGAATLALTPAVGSYSLTASYGGSSLDAASQSAPAVVVTVSGGLIATATTLTAVPGTVSFGQTVTLTAQVMAASGTTPTGAVTFLNGAAVLGSSGLHAGGVATLELTPAIGSSSVTAHYSGSTTDAGSTSAPVALTVNPAATTTTLRASPAAVAAGQLLTLTATVEASSGPAPTGTVTFHIAGPATLSAAASLVGGVGSFSLSTLPVGVYQVTANYAGSTTDDASSSAPPLTVTVTLPATATTLTASPNPAAFGASVTFTATVSNATLTPMGTVTFYEGGAALGTQTLIAGVADLTTSTLSAGAHTIRAVYAPAAGFSASQSAVLVEVVSATSFTVSAAPGARTVYTGEAAYYTVKVTPSLGFNLAVALSCSGLPANTTCAFSPATIDGGGSSTLLVQTTAPSREGNSTARLRASPIAVAGLLLLFGRRRRLRQGWRALVLGIALFVAVAATGCGGGALGGGTPVGAHTLTITGAASNGVSTLTQSGTVTLQVNSLF